MEALLDDVLDRNCKTPTFDEHHNLWVSFTWVFTGSITNIYIYSYKYEKIHTVHVYMYLYFRYHIYLEPK